MSQFQFKRTGDDDYPRYLKVLLQGPPKSGKTTFLSTAPNVVVAACEAGLASIAHLDVPYVEVDGTDKLQSLMMVLGDPALRAQAARTLGIDKVETVAIDTLDAWQDMLKKEIMAENRRTQMQQADWGTLKERMAAILKAFVALPLNVIFTVHTSSTQDEESRMIYVPALQGGIKDEIAGYVDFSLLSFRQRETGRDGIPKVNYYLKCEGDQKNPHLGGRAAGRLPEIVEPRFQILHDAVFSGIKRAPGAEAVSESEEAAPLSVQRTAQSLSHASVTETTSNSQPTVESTPAPAERKPGVPDDNPNNPINATGITMLTKAYIEQGLIVPEDLKQWTLGKGRKAAKYFMDWKTDKAAGAVVTRDDLIALLESAEAYNGEIEGVQTGVENLKSKPIENKPAADKVDAVPSGAPVESNSEPEQTEEGALAVLEQQLGAKVISHEAAQGAKCDVCDELVDDQDIANLAVMKFKKAMCVKDYKQAIRDSKK